MENPSMNFRSPFLRAVKHDDSEAVKKLLDQGMDPDVSFRIDGIMQPAICLCAERERTTLLEVLLLAGANIDQMDGHGRNSLHIAVLSDDVKMVAFLLSKGADVNQRASIMGNTPLHLAAHGFNLEIARLLIDAGADVNSRNGDLMTPLVDACTSLSMKMVLLRRPTMANSDAFGMKMSMLSFLSELLKAKSCVRSRDENGCTALHHIVEGNRFGDNAEALKLLLSYPCDVDATNDLGRTPLYVAAIHNNRKAILLLLKAGCRVDIGTRPVYLTPVEIAYLKGFYDVAELLLAAGARIKYEVLMAVREGLDYGDLSSLERLLAAGAECPKLYNLCRRTFYNYYGTNAPRLIDKLPLPPLIKRYLTFDIV